LDVALLIQGDIVVGNAEFHRNASEWFEHQHHLDKRYDSVILHICLNLDADLSKFNCEQLIINQYVIENIQPKTENSYTTNEIVNLNEELQHYALLRLLRKSTDAQLLLNKDGILNSLLDLAILFFDKYSRNQKRPFYTHEKLQTLLASLYNSDIIEFLKDIARGEEISIFDKMQMLMKNKFSIEGSHLRQELILNCVLPLSICLANEELRIGLFLWYWSTAALNTYGSLKRKFENIPQNFLWQQQGMLEYLREHGQKSNIVNGVIKDYGFAEVLSFYKSGRPPFKEINNE
jgi:hypothetical protein